MGDSEKGDRTVGSVGVGEVVGRTSLQEVEERIEARNAEESGTSSDEDNRPDEFSHWKRTPSIDSLHRGLLEVSKIAEASVEANLQIRADLRRALHIMEKTVALDEAMAPRVESTYWLCHKIDGELAEQVKLMHSLRMSVQGLQTDMGYVKDGVGQLPAIKELLLEILGRFPEKK